MLIDRRMPSRSSAGSYNYGLGTVTNTGGQFSFIGPAADLYRLITMHNYIPDGLYVVARRENKSLTASFVNSESTIKKRFFSRLM